VFTETEGTLGLRDGAQLSVVVGTVDLAGRVMIYRNATFRPSLTPPNPPIQAPVVAP
jgi:hypothetical protein